MSIYLFIILLLFDGKSDSLKLRLDEYLNKFLKDYSRFEYEIVAEPKSEGKEVVIDTDRQLSLKGNIGYVPVLIKNKKGEKIQAVLSIKLKLFKNVLIALNGMRSGEILQPENIQYQEVDVARCIGNFFNDTSRTNSYQAKTGIDKNEILLMSLLERIPVIKRGDNIIACVIKGNVRIDVDAIARQDGSENEIITVLTSDKKTFKARVIDRFSALIVE